MKYTYIDAIKVTDPDTKGQVELEIWKDNESGGILGVDSSFLEQNERVYNPFNGQPETIDDVMPVTMT